MRSRSRRSHLGIVGLVAAMLVVAACSVHPGAAAVVDGRTISQSYLDLTYEEVGNPNLDKETTLLLLIVAPYVIEAAAGRGVGVSESEARAEAQAGLAASEVSAGTVEFYRTTACWQNLTNQPGGPELINEVIAGVLAKEIDINPRYGDLNLQTGLIARAPLPWIVGG